MALMTPSFLPSQSYPFGPGAGKTGLRFLFEQLGLQEGVMGAGDMKVSQRAAGGANMSVDIAAGGAWIRGDDTARQGFYHGYNDAAMNVAVPANASGSPRFDQLIMRAYDSSIAGATDGLAFEVLIGTPNGAATTDNRLGAAALPNGAIRLAEWVTPNAAAAITDALIRDRRPWAQGVKRRIVRNSNAAAGNDYTGPGGAGVWTVDPTNLVPRLELSGCMVRIAVRCGMYHTVGGSAGFQFRLGNTILDHLSGSNPHFQGNAAANLPIPGNAEWDAIGHAAGTYQVPMIGWQGATAQGIYARADLPLEFVVEEDPRQNAQNGT